MGRSNPLVNCLGKASVPLLTLHCSLNVILTHYVRLHNASFLTSSAVFVSEVFKFGLCLVCLVHQEKRNFLTSIEPHFRTAPLAKLFIPAFLFTIQNNLFYLANTNLDSTTYQITYQFKIVTTAFFSFALLGKLFSKTQVFSLIVLMFGIVLIQMENSASDMMGLKANQNQVLGFCQVILASLSSGFTSVYLEKIYKSSDDTLLVKNLQLSLLSIPISIANMLILDAPTLSQHGPFHAFDWLVIAAVLFNAAGGLIIALVLKHHDNIVKIFSTSVSIVLTCILTVYLFEKRINQFFLFGLTHVFIAIYLYYF